MRSRATLALLAASSVSAWELPFSKIWSGSTGNADQVPLAVLDSTTTSTGTQVQGPPRVAIIGAGAAGSSAAFFISKAKERFGMDVEVDVYEQNDYVGGRSTTVYPYDDMTLEPVELGASIFVAVNKNMMRASDEFNFTRIKFAADANEQMGIWDGKEFLFTQGTRGNGYFGSWFDTLKVFWRYGYSSPMKTQSIVNALVSRFTDLYTPTPPRWTNITSIITELGWADQVVQTGTEYFTSQGVSEKFIHELVGAATRVNYAQDADKIHALEASVSLAATGATAIEGGNWRVFDEFVRRSGAKLYLKDKVSTVKKVNADTWLLRSSSGTRRYNTIILAAPAPLAGLELPGEELPPVDYVNLHTTLFATTAPHADPEYFGYKPGSKVPETILTAKGDAEFNSMTYHGRLKDADGVPLEPPQWVVKIFSMEKVEDAWIEKLFGHEVTWVYRKFWQPYPILPPTTSFPSIKLDDGFYYINAFEPAISTMETETIAARNVVELMLQEQFGLAGLCPFMPKGDEGFQTETDASDFVYGWDCPVALTTTAPEPETAPTPSVEVPVTVGTEPTEL
ncbi:FAD/NAD(P)-binding domain-containing protein [Peniophora sp. CONT]|nr:FAD/NAD(P)-binding domain-containing protein [Peniophora sp. CONT]